MSGDLAWQIIRNNSCFLRRQRGIDKHFSREPFNLKGVNSQRYNGLVNKNGLDISVNPEKKTIVVATKTKHFRKPAKATQTQVLRRRGARATVKAVTHIAKHQNRRLAKVAARRASQLIRSLRRTAAKKA